MGIQLFDKMLSRCIGYFDVLVTSSPRFHVQFNVSSSQPRLPDIFMVLLNDSSTCHQVLLSSMILPEEVPASSLSSLANKQENQLQRSSSIWLPVIITTVFTFITVAVVFVVYVCIHVKARYSVEEMEKTESVLLNNVDTVKVPEKVYTPSTIQPASRTIVFSFILLYVAYSILFTFSVAFGILYISQFSVLSNFTKVSNLTDKLHHEITLSVDKLKYFESKEISYLKKQFKQRKDACSQHLNIENSKVLTQQVSDLESQLQFIYVQNGSLQFLADSMARSNAAKHIEKIQAFIQECNKTVHKHFKRLSETYYSELEDVSKNGWFDFPRETFLRQKKENFDTMSSTHLVQFMTWLQMDKADALLSVDETIDNSLASLAPSIESLVAININSIESNSVPHIKVTNSTLQAYQYIVMQRSKGEATAANKGEIIPSDNRTTTNTVQVIDLKLNSMLFILIALFLFVDIFLLVFRLAWLYTQVQEVREGCEELIPQDEAARKVLKTKTGQNPPRHYDAFDHACPFTPNANENINQDNELNVYFCQSYPRSKEDILRDIWAQKMSVKTKTSKEKLQDIWLVQDILSCACWFHRVLMSKLLWRVLCCCGVIVFVSCVICVLDSWLCQENFHSLVGVDLLMTELDWQTTQVNQHLAAVTEAMNSDLHNLKITVDSDTENTNTILWNTWHEEMNILVSMLSILCNRSGTESCDLSFLQPAAYHHTPLSSCNFLPLQVTTYTDLDMVKIETLSVSELSPLLDLYRHIVFMTAYILIVLLCANVACQVVARTVKDYLVVSGHVPRARIYQFSNTMTGMSDDPNDPEKEIHRSASWLESCESGVYVGDNDDSARESTI